MIWKKKKDAAAQSAEAAGEMTGAKGRTGAGAFVIFDFVSKWAARNYDKHESVKRTKARFHFGLNDPHTIEQWFPKLKLIERFYFISEEKKRWGLPGLIMWLIPALHKSFGIVGYKVGEISK